MKIRSPEGLLKFYREYLEWVYSGAEQGAPFFPDAGICDNLYAWKGKPSNSRLNIALRAQFEIFGYKGGELHFPFGGEDQYMEQHYEGTMHRDPRRIQWVKDRLEDGVRPVIKSSSHLLRFYRRWRDWSEGKLSSDHVFRGERSLCVALSYHCQAEGLDFDVYLTEMQRQFSQDGLNNMYPFGGPAKFRENHRNKDMQRNPERNAWVYERIADGHAE